MVGNNAAYADEVVHTFFQSFHQIVHVLDVYAGNLGQFCDVVRIARFLDRHCFLRTESRKYGAAEVFILQCLVSFQVVCRIVCGTHIFYVLTQDQIAYGEFFGAHLLVCAVPDLLCSSFGKRSSDAEVTL